MNPAELREAIAEKARAVGFEKVGFAPPQLVEARSRFGEWLARDLHGEMGYMARDAGRRADASMSLEGSQTVICCALNYYQGTPTTVADGHGVISSYARGEDYHRVLERKLREVAAFIEERALVPTKVYVDTGPLLEKGFAAAAGIGWVGKHTNLISSKGSSWFFLGEILVPLDIAFAEPVVDRCGTCTRCMTACPTGAIVEPYVVDSRLCISYLTIELRGVIPRDLRPLIGNRIYGCDDCQDVCPWNRFAVKSEEASFFPREPLASLDLIGLLRMTRDDFLSATKQSAIRRARYGGFLRNVAVALGNEGHPRAVPALVEALGHVESLVRGHAAWALAEIGSESALPPLRARLQTEIDPAVREELAWAIGRLDRGNQILDETPKG